jgi:DNA-binding GntR family transcriptional regulator
MRDKFGVKKYLSNNDIYQILRNEILNLQIKPGQPLSENTVARRFNISRTPIRSVFEHLIEDDLLEVNPRKGTFVTLLDLDAINQVVFLRTKVEIGVMSILAKYPDQALFQELRDNLEQQKQKLMSGMTPESFYVIDSQFHELCMAALNRHKLWQFIQKLSVHYSRYRMLDYISTQRLEALYKEHCTLFDIIVNGQVNKIEKHVTEHFCGGIVSIGERLTTEFKDYFDESSRPISDILDDLRFMIHLANEN